MNLKVKVNDSHFQYQLRDSQDAYMYLMQNCWIQAQICYKFSRGQIKYNSKS